MADQTQDQQDQPQEQPKADQPKEQPTTAKKTFFFPPDVSIEAETLEDAMKAYEKQQKGNAKA